MTRPQVLEPRYDDIPAELRAQRRWLVWRHTQRDDKWAKVPYRATDGRMARSTEPTDWCDYDDALLALALGDYDGLGFALGDGYHGVDVDDCRAGDEWSPLALGVLDAVPGYAEVSPSGQGLKIITRSTLDRSHADHAKGLEVYTAGRYFAITGHRITGHDSVPADPVDLSAWEVEHFGASRSRGVDTGWSIPKPPLAVTDEQLHGALGACLSAGRLDGYSDWLAVGMALHHQFSGGADGLELWDQYSSQAAGYTGREALMARWQGFDASRGDGATFATVLGWAKAAGWTGGTRAAGAEAVTPEAAAASAAALAGYQARILSAEYAELTGALAAEIRADTGLPPVDRAVLVGAVQRRIKALQGSLPPVAEVRDMLAPARAEGSVDAPAWLLPWVFLAGENVFVHRTNKRKLTRQGFDGEFNRLLPGAGQAMVSASRDALETWDVATVHGERYAPAAPEVFEQEGVAWLNSYRHDLVPVGYWDAEVASVLEEHLKLLVPHDVERAHLKRWMAWVARNPGKKVLHVVLIKGTQGDGKSLLVRVMQAAMGGNVQVIDTNAMQQSSFTEWAQGACLGVFEEIHVARERYDVVDRLKQFITNPLVSIHPKGKPMVSVPNTQNYLAFTNHDDSVPVGDTDRRWYVLFSPWRHRRDLEAAVGDPVRYWQRLSDAIDQGAAVRGWLDAVDLSGFNPFGAAPETVAKKRMIHAAKSDMVKAVQAIIDAGDAVGVSREIVSYSHLLAALRADGYQDRDIPKTSAVPHLMAELGFIEGDRVSVAGRRYSTWKREAVSKAAVIEWVRSNLAL